jgi:serine/threonine protein kinase
LDPAALDVPARVAWLRGKNVTLPSSKSILLVLLLVLSISQGMRSLPHSGNMRWPEQPYNFLRRTFPELSDAGLRLLNALLTYDPDQRMTAQQALTHEYFRVRA